ncbi:putative PurR-regulated permease PerM [Rhizobium azooxidifex]|uniref:Putative PurR-regulated permease PerM n=1 Tax=Mycoplana azooxidifex TaxID=1636188 RepID=A0A7W6DBL4_9HYPH|nr:AI-2E family transporter [Mycoplana azooxidifex]MBB3978236.1 putative PurR-regulated permease PerM [Mycoplana azooxidifex]
MAKRSDEFQDLDVPSLQGARPNMPTLLTFVGAVAMLYLARDVFLPIAIALLLTFALAPVVTMLRRVGFSRILAVISTALFAFSLIAVVSLVIALQVTNLARSIPTYQANVVSKIEAMREAGSGTGIFSQISSVFERISREISETSNEEAAPAKPVLVEIYAPDHPIQVLTNLIVPLLAPVAMAGLVIVVVIFMLLEREDLRDRFIRLVGYGDLHRTTEALEDAGTRVGHYLLMQLVVNILYGLPVAAGLWLIGIPNAILWGLLAIVFRFVPYIGPIIAMILPLFLAVAVAPGWTMLIWTATLFIVMELVINNVVEPTLYGSKTGLSPLAIIVSAIFWAWIWGPVGLVLSTPLTVCLVVLGKHVPQFGFLQVLFGSDPVLAPHARLYQRLLAGDPDEATDQAEERLEEDYLVDYYATVAIPALALAEHDRARGVMSETQRLRVAESGMTLVANMDDIALEEAQEDDGEDALVEPDVTKEAVTETGEGQRILCLGGRGELDDVTAAMLAQVLRVEGAHATAENHRLMEPARIRQIPVGDFDTIVICYLNQDSLKHARFAVRRLKRINAALRVGVALWKPGEEEEEPDLKAAVEAGAALNADFLCTDMTTAAIATLTTAPVVPLAVPGKVRARRRLVPDRPKVVNLR